MEELHDLLTVVRRDFSRKGNRNLTTKDLLKLIKKAIKLREDREEGPDVGDNPDF